MPLTPDVATELEDRAISLGKDSLTSLPERNASSFLTTNASVSSSSVVAPRSIPSTPKNRFVDWRCPISLRSSSGVDTRIRALMLHRGLRAETEEMMTGVNESGLEIWLIPRNQLIQSLQ
jgi:hypothetical protein